MNREHLTDEELQEFLDESLSLGKSRMDHIQSCESCRRALEAYRNLFTGIRTDPGFKLPRHFAKTVAAKAMRKVNPLATHRFEITLIAAGVLVVLGLGILLTHFPPFIETIRKVALPQEFDSAVVQPIRRMLDGLNGSLILIPFAGLALVFVLFIDRFINKSRQNKLAP